jgi:nitrile hydratase accessory protein
LTRPENAGALQSPYDPEQIVFEEAWQAQAFALAVSLREAGAFTWPEWTEIFAAEIAARPEDDGTHYYEAWLAALEKIVTARGLGSITPAALDGRKHAWQEAYRHTPHGQPVELVR